MHRQALVIGALRLDLRIPAVVDVLETRAGIPGLRFLDRHGETVPW